MENAWNAKDENEKSDSTERHHQDENNNGNIGREASAGINERDQIAGERGQFGTTGEHGSGSLKDRPKQAGNENRPPENQTTQDRWNQGTEGSPGKGYSDDYTSGRANTDPGNAGAMGPGGASSQSGENYGTAGNSAESQGVGGMYRASGQDFQNQSSANTTNNQGNTWTEGNPDLNRNPENKTRTESDFDDDDDPRDELL